MSTHLCFAIVYIEPHTSYTLASPVVWVRLRFSLHLHPWLIILFFSFLVFSPSLSTYKLNLASFCFSARASSVQRSIVARYSGSLLTRLLVPFYVLPSHRQPCTDDGIDCRFSRAVIVFRGRLWRDGTGARMVGSIARDRDFMDRVYDFISSRQAGCWYIVQLKSNKIVSDDLLAGDHFLCKVTSSTVDKVIFSSNSSKLCSPLANAIFHDELHQILVKRNYN